MDRFRLITKLFHDKYNNSPWQNQQWWWPIQSVTQEAIWPWWWSFQLQVGDAGLNDLTQSPCCWTSERDSPVGDRHREMRLKSLEKKSFHSFDCICYLEPTHCEIVLIAWVSSEAEHSEGNWSGGKTSQSQFSLTGISLLQQRRQLQDSDLQKQPKKPSM